MIRRPPRSTQSRSSAASDVYKRQVVDGDERDCPAGLADPLDDGRQDVRELRGYDEKSLLIGLRRDDLQQGHDLAGGRQPVLDQAVVADLQQFLDPAAFSRGPFLV